MGSTEFTCECGLPFINSTDNRSFVAHYITDQKYDEFSEIIDDAIEKSGPSPREKEEACMKWREFRMPQIWQCYSCGNLYLEDQTRKRYLYKPESSETPKRIFKRET